MSTAVFPKRFFEISLCFASKVAEISKEPIENTLLQYTNFYIRLNLGRDFKATNPIWEEYLKGLKQANDQVEWTYAFYLQRKEQASSKLLDSAFGCFSYTLLDPNRVRLHFHSCKTSEHSPLSRAQIDQRLSELRLMFAHLKQEVHAPAVVIGASWLYNLESYRRLFPPAYLATARVGGNDFPYLPLWGQFIDHKGRIKEDLAARFLASLNEQHQLEGIERCFPFQVLHLEGSTEEFYPFYEV